jgi:hypothetical protein
MLATVRKIVSISPRRIVSWVKYLATTPHLKLGLVETEIRMPRAKRLQRIQATYSKVLRRRSLGLSVESIPVMVSSLLGRVDFSTASP